MLLPTTVVGSYPQPDWLVDRKLLQTKGVPRVKAPEVWRVAPEFLAEAHDAAVLAAVFDQVEAGIDIVSDGEIRRESYFNHFANALGGIDHDEPGKAINRSGTYSAVPRVVGPVTRQRPIEVDAARFLRGATSRQIKVTVPGPFTLSQLAQDEHYRDQRLLALDLADAVNQELRDLVSAGVDVIQVDEPYLQANADAARHFAIEVIDRAVAGISATTVLHTCYGYAVYVKNKQGGYPFLAELADCAVDQIAIEAAQPQLDLGALADLGAKTIVLGVIDLGTEEVESLAVVADRVRAALQHVPAERLVLAPDCGMKFLSRAVAKAKLQALAAGVAVVRAELT